MRRPVFTTVVLALLFASVSAGGVAVAESSGFSLNLAATPDATSVKVTVTTDKSFRGDQVEVVLSVEGVETASRTLKLNQSETKTVIFPLNLTDGSYDLKAIATYQVGSQKYNTTDDGSVTLVTSETGPSPYLLCLDRAVVTPWDGLQTWDCKDRFDKGGISEYIGDENDE